MTSPLRKLAPAIISLATIGFSATVASQNSGGSITYGPGSSAAVPTLGGSALIVLAILLAVIAFRVMRTQQHKGVNLVVALTALTALASGVGGINLVSDAWAIPGSVMTDAGGGALPLNEGYNEVRNATEVPQKILDIQFAPGCGTNAPNGGAPNGGSSIQALNGGGVGECNDNPSTTVPPAAYCTLNIFCERG